jgi:hypothetical protein
VEGINGEASSTMLQQLIFLEMQGEKIDYKKWISSGCDSK